MTSPRAVAAFVFLVGLVAGTLEDTGRTGELPREEDYWILAADFHVHAFVGDGGLAPWALRREAERAGLDVFAITNHNQVFAARIGRWLSRGLPGPLVLVGEEITARNYHLIAVGIQRTVDWDQSADAAVDAVHAQGGVAIAAHPYRMFWDGFNDRALTLLDGVEAAHPDIHVDDRRRNELETFYGRARQHNAGVAPIGSSDFHVIAPLGFCRTYVFARERSEAGVVDAVRNGRTVAVDGGGNTYGDAEFVRRVVAHRARTAQVAPLGTPWLRRFSVACAWIGLVGIVLLSNTPFRSSRRHDP